MNKKLTILLTILFIGFVGLGIHNVRGNQVELKSREIKLQDAVIELNELKLQKEKLNQDFEKATQEKDINEEKVRQLEQEKLDLERRYKELEVSKAQEKEQKLASRTASVAGASNRGSITGNKEEWLRASGIPESDWWAVDSIVSRESGWNPCAYNPGRSDCNANPTSACGLAQSLPCGKQAKFGHWTDPVANLKWQHEYVTARYGGYPQAVAFWNANHWY